MVAFGKTWGIKIGGMVGIALVNVFLNLIFKALTKFKKYVSKTEENVSLVTLIFVSSFINMVVITLFINIDFGLY